MTWVYCWYVSAVSPKPTHLCLAKQHQPLWYAMLIYLKYNELHPNMLLYTMLHMSYNTIWNDNLNASCCSLCIWNNWKICFHPSAILTANTGSMIIHSPVLIFKNSLPNVGCDWERPIFCSLFKIRLIKALDFSYN